MFHSTDASMSPVIVHLDMNSYFASVEQQANVHLRGRPVGVCAYLQPRGCVIAASVEAKRLGIKVGMTVQEARQKAPDTFFVQNDPAKYRAVTSRIFGILSEISDRIEHYSIDEAFLDLTGWCRDAAEAAFIFSRVKKRIREEVGEWLRCSVGIAHTRFLAKFASDRQKPDGMVVITKENLDWHLAHADLEDACGIGKRLRRRLERLGIHTLLELKIHPIGNLFHAFGIDGYRLWCHVHGIECERLIVADAYHHDPLPKSIGHSFCVPNRVNREKKVAAVLAKLIERAGQRLRASGLLAGEMIVVIGRRGHEKSSVCWRRLGESVDDVFRLQRVAAELLVSHWHGEEVNFLAVTFSDLHMPTRQGDLGVTPRQNFLSATLAIDAIQSRYGPSSVFLGRLFAAMNAHDAPDRIGFRKVDGIEVPR